jgi:hypothetical protein
VSEPAFRIRKHGEDWTVQQRIDWNGHRVWGFVGAFKTWAVALAVTEVESGADGYPYFKEAK